MVDPAAPPLLESVLAGIASAPSADAAIDLVRQHGRALLRADGIAVVRRDGDLTTYVAENAIGPLWNGGSFPISSCVAGTAILARETLVIADITTAPGIPLNLYLATFVKSMIVAPALTPSGEAVGAVCGYWRIPGETPAAARATAEALAERLAGAMRPTT